MIVASGLCYSGDSIVRRNVLRLFAQVRWEPTCRSELPHSSLLLVRPTVPTPFAPTPPQAPYTMDIPVLSYSTSAPGQASNYPRYGTSSGSSGFGGGGPGFGGGGSLMRQATTHHREASSQWQGLQRSSDAGSYGSFR